MGCYADIATAQPCHQNNVYTFRSQFVLQNNLLYRNEKRLLYPWKSFSIPQRTNNFNMGRIELWRGRLIIKAVATLEPIGVSQSDGGFKLRVDSDSAGLALSGNESKSSIEDSNKLNEREKLRRMRISKANKGNIPWNKGRKHTPGSFVFLSCSTFSNCLYVPKILMYFFYVYRNLTADKRENKARNAGP